MKKPKYKKGSIVTTLFKWSKWVYVNVKIHKVIKNKNGKYQYSVWKFKRSTDHGSYWTLYIYDEDQLYESPKEAYNYLLSKNVNKYMISTNFEGINEVPPVKDSKIKKWNKENYIS